MILIDYKSRKPIYEQIIDNVKELIVSGVLERDEQLPSVRQLAQELAINPNTIQKAYAELERQGVIYSLKGRGSFVGSSLNELRSVQQAALLEEKHAAKYCRRHRAVYGAGAGGVCSIKKGSPPGEPSDCRKSAL